MALRFLETLWTPATNINISWTADHVLRFVS